MNYVGILWHQHQPLYAPLDGEEPTCLPMAAVRLHAARDYYAMAALAAEQPGVHLTFNLTASLIRQLEAYAEGRVTDRFATLTLADPSTLDDASRELLLSRFFDVSWQHDIASRPRYVELFRKRAEGVSFTDDDYRDLAALFNLAWLNPMFYSPYELQDGTVIDIHDIAQRGAHFSQDDKRRLIEVQLAIVRSVLPLYRRLRNERKVEITTTPFYHPILPLLIDATSATIDRPGAVRPAFAAPEDARMQIGAALRLYETQFGESTRGMWPAEGAVSPAAAGMFADAGIRWIASADIVLRDSGKWGYETHRPEVLYRPYRVDGTELSIFFRDSDLSNSIAFRLQELETGEAAYRLVEQIAARFTSNESEDGFVSIILDGENTWNEYPRHGLDFLRQFYFLLAQEQRFKTCSFGDYLDGTDGVAAHPVGGLATVHELRCGSWIDEPGSARGSDLGTWAGEGEENLAWRLVRDAREAVLNAKADAAVTARAMESVYAAEGSDWFWWYGDDQNSGRDEEFDEILRAHLLDAYRVAGLNSPLYLHQPIGRGTRVWTFTSQVDRIAPGEELVLRTPCPGLVQWQFDNEPAHSVELHRSPLRSAGRSRYEVRLSPPFSTHRLAFRFFCGNASCGPAKCCDGREHYVEINEFSVSEKEVARAQRNDVQP